MVTGISGICGCPLTYRDYLRGEIKFLYHYGIELFHLPMILFIYSDFREQRRLMEANK